MSTLLKTTALALCSFSICISNAQQGQNGFLDRTNMDETVNPGDDFYTYANGAWVKNNPIPEKETRWGSFNVLRDFNINAVKNLLEKAAADKNATNGTVTRRVGDFYAAGMDSMAIEKLGYTPIKKDLARIETIKNLEGVLNEINYLRSHGIASPLYVFYVAQDRKNVEKMAVQLGQGGTGLSDKDYYFKDDKRSQDIRDAYKTYITALFTLINTPTIQAQKNAEIIFNIEKHLAAAHLNRVELRDAYLTYNKLSVEDFSKTTPNISWSQTLKALKASGEDSIIVNNPKFFVTVDSLINATPVQNLKIYLQWYVLRAAAPYLNSSFVNASFAYNQVITGQKIQTPRWQRISSLTDGSIGELLGQLYVKEYFKPAAKKRMQQLVDNLRKAFAIRINNLDWMSDATKQKALAKLAAFRPKIAYPSQWQNYNGLLISRNNFFQNIRNVDAWKYNDMVSRLGKPIDRERWAMTPPTVNAYYNATLNEIVFPAGILQFPFFDPNADDAINYGGIGAVIGHEMSHGFDDNGSKYDADGTLRNWWTDEDRKKFEAKADALAKQFDAYTVLDTLYVNGKLTLGENIGDLGGLNVAYEAFKMTKQGQSSEKTDGFTPDQRFFLAWAQIWRTNILPQAAAQQIVTDTHAPAQYRTIGPVVNMDAWYKAFNVKEGDKLYKKPEERIKIW